MSFLEQNFEKWLFLGIFLPFFDQLPLLGCNLAYLRYFWSRGPDVIFSRFRRFKYIPDLLELARTHPMKSIPSFGPFGPPYTLWTPLYVHFQFKILKFCSKNDIWLLVDSSYLPHFPNPMVANFESQS